MAAVESVETSLDPVLDAAPDEDDRDHMACCRELLSDGPVAGFCGAVEDKRTAFSDHICEECVDVVTKRHLELGIPIPADGSFPPFCVRDGSPCPTGDEADALAKRILGMD